MRGSWPSCCTRTCSDRSITVSRECERSRSLRAAYQTNRHRSHTGDDSRESDLPAAGGLPVLASSLLRRAIAASGSARSPKPACGAGPSSYYQQFDAAEGCLRQEVRRELLAEAQKHDAWEIVTRDSVHRADPGGSADCFDPDTRIGSAPSDSLDLQRVWNRDPQQCRSSVSSRENYNVPRNRSRFVD